MENHHFISYSVADAPEFALTLCDKLIAGPPSKSAWLDKREIKPGQDWDKQVVEAIKTCRSMIFVMTKDSVEDESGCKNEWVRALKYKKPVIPLLLHNEVDLPFQLGSRQYIDFTINFEQALARLRDHIKWLDSPDGKFQALKDRLADANRDLRRAEDAVQKTRIRDEIEFLKKQITDQEQIVKDPEGTKQRVEKSIVTGIERERQPVKPKTSVSRTKFINLPPGKAPIYFQDRHVETKLIADFVENDVERLMTVVGRAGVGKTAMVCRLLKSLESGRLPKNGKELDDGKELSIDGIVYLSERGSRKVNFPDLFSDLRRLLPDEVTNELDILYKNAKISTTDKTKALLRAFPLGRFIVLLDNFEDKINFETREINDEEMKEALETLLSTEQHAVKVILTTRVAPKSLTLMEPGRQKTLVLDEGLKSPYAENILREMDKDGKLGLREAPDEVLDEARQRTNGYPRALEALFAILSADREASLNEVLADVEQILPEHVVEKMVGEAYSRLDSEAQMAMQALAIYGRPVSNVALDFLLQPFLTGVNSSYVLNRLVNMQFVRREGIQYYLHPVDREYALSRIPKGEPEDGLIVEYVFSQYTLFNRGAQFYRKIRLPRKDWKSIDDLDPQLAEFDLLCEGGDYDTAAVLLLEIDFEYILLWGHFKLVATLHEQLQGKIYDPDLKSSSLNNLGVTYYRLGVYSQAIACLEKALEIDREMDDLKDEGTYFLNLANCYMALGNLQKAIEYAERSLKIDRQVGNENGEAICLYNLGLYYSYLGDTVRSIELTMQALEIDRRLEIKEGQSFDLCLLSTLYMDQGKSQQAMAAVEESLQIAKKIGSQLLESEGLNTLGKILLVEERFDEAAEKQKQGIQLADKIGYISTGSEARYDLGLIFFYQNNLDEAIRIINEALKYDYPLNKHKVLKLQGLIYLLEQDTSKAFKAFTMTIKNAESLVAKDQRNYNVLDSKGIALCGLALCEKEKNYLKEAKHVYSQARKINRDIGYVKRELRLFDKLTKMDEEGMLEGLRTVVSGG